MLSPERRINVQFLKLGAAERAKLKKFIDEGLIAKTLGVDQNWDPSRPAEQRQFVRVAAGNFVADVFFPKQKKPISCSIVNISLGGICLLLPSGIELKAKDEISMVFAFLPEKIKVAGQVLEVVISSAVGALV